MSKFINRLFRKKPEYPPVECMVTSSDAIRLLEKVTQEQRDNIIEGIKQAKHDVLNQSYEALDKEGNLGDVLPQQETMAVFDQIINQIEKGEYNV